MFNGLFNFNETTQTNFSAHGHFHRYNLSAELGQQQNLSYSIVRHILNSRRLLIDHVECLENSILEIELGIPKSEIFTLTNFSIAAGLAVLFNVAENVVKPIKYSATMIAGAYGLIWSYKCAKKFKNNRVKRRVDTLVQIIANFGNGVKKNVSYFNELAFMKSGEVPIDDVHYKRAWGCIQAIKTVTESLFNATRDLESNYPLSAYFNDLYIPMEDLSSCDYFTRQIIEYNPRHIKDFYNIFAYVQSQFLLRLGLTVVENSSINFLQNDIQKLLKKIQKIFSNEEENFLKISLALKKKYESNRSKKRSADFENRNFAPSTVLKETSMKLTSSLIAVAEECEKFDSALQNISEESSANSEQRTKLLSMAETMRSIELSLSACNDDFQRMMLIYNKFVGHKLVSTSDLKSLLNSEANNTIENLQSLSLPDQQLEEAKGDDYFAYTYDEGFRDDLTDYQKYTDYDLHRLDEKISKNHFKPVLKQLRTKIDPIREDMMQNERRILQAKGIDVEKFFSNDDGSNQPDHSDSDSDSSSIIQNNEKRIKTDKYDELREFLARKAPVSLFSLPQPRSGLFEEDILE